MEGSYRKRRTQVSGYRGTERMLEIRYIVENL